VLPDFSRNRHGYIRQPGGPPNDGEQILYMGNERFSIPEVLFCPDHIGTSTLREARCLQEMTCCL
jgi:actin-related protein 6